ncbi:unnamed protein product [Polarella glacialis]|uniref:tRNA/rRNA methyltransferase SpoU type domain-containing protein n=1 Tax=Polarella glacialis TaxID=89957 RepID=A0A813HIS8_POLGL|nr:unnamed protein product [Polarella glacialis]
MKEGTPATSSASAPGSSADEERRKAPESYLLLFNVGKKQNFGTLLRSACAFGVSEVVIVGAKKLATFGNQGTAQHAQTRHFDSLEAAKEFLTGRGARICGIEIDDNAKPVSTHPFSGPTAFMLGNEGIGMSPQQRAACDFFVYIPQHSGATASLNVAVAGSIVLHHFATWAAMPEHPRLGEKFVVQPARGSLEKFSDPTQAEREEMNRKRSDRASKRRLEEDVGEENDLGDDVEA